MAHHLLFDPYRIIGRSSRAEEHNTVQYPNTHWTIADHFVSNEAVIEDPENHDGDDNDHEHEMISFDRLALGSERLGRLGLRSALGIQTLTTLSRLRPYKTPV